MRPLKCIVIILTLFVFVKQAKATHNRAGEITYKWLFGYTYQIKITTYTNIGSTGLADRCEDTLHFGDGTTAVVLRSNGGSGLCSFPAKDGVPLPGGTIKLNEYVTNHPEKGRYKKHVTYFLVKTKHENITLIDSGGIDDAKWFKFSDILDLNFYDDILPIITKAVKRIAEITK